MPGEQELRWKVPKRPALVTEQLQRETGVELRIVQPPPLELPVLVMLDEVVIGVAGKGEGVEPQRIHPARQLQEPQVVASPPRDGADRRRSDCGPARTRRRRPAHPTSRVRRRGCRRGRQGIRPYQDAARRRPGCGDSLYRPSRSSERQWGAKRPPSSEGGGASSAAPVSDRSRTIQDDLHACKYRCRSSSPRIPRSFARRLQ